MRTTLQTAWRALLQENPPAPPQGSQQRPTAPGHLPAPPAPAKTPIHLVGTHDSRVDQDDASRVKAKRGPRHSAAPGHLRASCTCKNAAVPRSETDEMNSR